MLDGIAHSGGIGLNVTAFYIAAILDGVSLDLSGRQRQTRFAIRDVTKRLYTASHNLTKQNWIERSGDTICDVSKILRGEAQRLYETKLTKQDVAANHDHAIRDAAAYRYTTGRSGIIRLHGTRRNYIQRSGKASR